MTTTPPGLSGIHHLELTVRDLARSLPWYTAVLGLPELRRFAKDTHDVVMLGRPGGLVVALVQHHDPAGADRFDERRPGLDHVGFAVEDAAAVEAWAAHLDAHGVTRSEVKDGALPGSRLVVFRDPDGIQLECYVSS